MLNTTFLTRTSMISGGASVVILIVSLFTFGIILDQIPPIWLANLIASSCIITSVISITTAIICNLDTSKEGAAAAVSLLSLGCGILYFCNF